MRYLGLIFAAATLALSSGCSDHKPESGSGAPAAKLETASKTTDEPGKCAKHGDPEELCFVCDATLREKGRLWCTEHDRYEDRCFICHPELKDTKRLWCVEHSLYEDECHICHPEVAKKPEAAAAPAEPVAGTAIDLSAAKGKCAKHGDPAALCFMCDAGLRQKGRLWCTEHDRYEDRCFICHPELKDTKRLWCEEHSLYEDECHICHPEVLKKSDDAAPAGKPSASLDPNARDPKRLWCEEHSVHEDECGICHPELASGLSFGGGLKIRFLTEEAAGKVGVRTTKSRSGQTSSTVTCLAEVGYNRNRLAEITPMIEGIIRTVAVDLGSRVKQGDLLATISSVGISQAQGKYLSALAEVRLAEETIKREQELRAKSISPEQDLQIARAALAVAQARRDTAQQHLLTLGASTVQLKQLATNRRATGTLEMRAPFAGEVIERSSVPGALAKAGVKLFRVADLSSMWAMLTLPEAQLSSVLVGQSVRLKADAHPGQEFTGQLTWISSEVDRTTRMAKARAEFDNSKGRLRANMFATAEIELSAPQSTVLIPDQSVQWLGNRPFAFVRETRDLYSARPLLLGARTDGFRAVMAGLQAGENIVSEGSFSLKSQFLISRLGAGCVDD